MRADTCAAPLAPSPPPAAVCAHARTDRSVLWCTQTGQYGVRTGFLDVLTPIASPGTLPLDTPQLAEGMKQLGYATGLVGKW